MREFPVPSPSFRRVIAATGLVSGDKSVVGHAFAAVRPDGEVVIAHLADEMAGDSSDRQVIIDAFRILALDYREPELNVSLKVELIDREKGLRGVCDVAERENADLICITAADHSRHAHEVLLMSQTAVLIVPKTNSEGDSMEDEGCCFWSAYDVSLRGDRGGAEPR